MSEMYDINKDDFLESIEALEELKRLEQITNSSNFQSQIYGFKRFYIEELAENLVHLLEYFQIDPETLINHLKNDKNK